jgi:hypothetical protein
MVNSTIIISASSKSKILVIAITVAVIVVILAAGWISKEAYSYSNNAPDFNLKTRWKAGDIIRVI